MKRTLMTIAALIVVQAAIVGLWFAVERGRRPPPHAELAQLVAARRTTHLDRPLPDLTLRLPDGAGLRLTELQDRPLVLHFWATWCPPCRDELPGLLDYAATEGAQVLAVSVDRDIDTVRRFFDGDLPPSIMLANAADVERALDVRSLPVTFIVDDTGSLRLRLDGARDWTSPSVREEVWSEAGR